MVLDHTNFRNHKVKYYRGYHGSQQRNIGYNDNRRIMMTIEEIIIKEIMITVKNIKKRKGMVKEKDMIEIKK
jgi:hypothetical protein